MLKSYAFFKKRLHNCGANPFFQHHFEASMPRNIMQIFPRPNPCESEIVAKYPY